MRIGVFPWLWQLLFDDGREPPHVCSEFTQWTAVKTLVRIVSTADYKKLSESEQFEVEKYYQQRRCTLCGKIFQANLAHAPAQEQPLEGDDDA